MSFFGKIPIVAPLAFLAACSTRGAGPREPGPPALGDGLDVAAPAEVGLQPAVLAPMLAAAGAEPHKDLKSILVARRGRLAVEAYFNGADRETLHDIRSVGKSITGTLVGIALHEGRIPSLDRPLVSYFPDASKDAPGARRSEVTVRHLLEMRSGLGADDWSGQDTTPGFEGRMETSPDWLRFALEVPMAAPAGSRWAYASINAMLLGGIISLATGRDPDQYGKEKLFAPLAFGPYRWQRDPQGHVIAQGAFWIRPRDLLKLGLLYLQHGRWHGRQLLPETWIAEATRPHTTFTPGGPFGLGDFYKGYGYFWLTGAEKTGSTTHPFYFASGNGGQKIFVVPDLEMVVTITSSAYQRGYAHPRSHAIFRQCLQAAQ